jgi:hypothetical protein
MLSGYRALITGVTTALAMGALLIGCGGGGGSDPSPSATTVTVAPSLGRFDKGTKVSLKKTTDKTLIKEGEIGEDGKAVIDIGSYTGHILVEVKGGDGVKYFDEGTGQKEDFPLGEVLKAVAPAGSSEIGVSVLTHAAAEKMGANLEVDNIRKENTQIAQQFGLVDLLAPPVLLGDGDKVESTDGEAGKYALLLAGFAKAADTAGYNLIEAVKALADDLSDGKLDGKKDTDNVEKSLLKTHLDGALATVATDFAQEDAKDFFQAKLDQIVIAETTPELTQAQLDAIGAAGSDLSKAKKFFTDLRQGILPYANDADNGFLNSEGRKLQDEVDALTENTVNGLEGTIDLGVVIWDYLEGTMDGCTPITSNSASCMIDFDRGVKRSVSISNNTANQVVTYSFNANESGTIAYTMSGNSVTGITLNGTMPGMTLNTRSTVENLAITRTASSGDMYRFTLSGKMTDKLIIGGTSVLSLQFANGSIVDAHMPDNADNEDLSKFVFDVTGIYSTANYSFKGRFQISNVVEKEYTEQNCWWNGQQWQSCEEYEIVSGKASFTGTISGIGLVDTNVNNNFDILIGKLEAEMKDTNNYNPALPDSASNYLTGSMTFTGTTFMSSTDAGLKLVLSVTVTGNDTSTISVNYSNASKGISITGSTNWNDADNAPPQSITLTDASGIKIILIEDNDNAEVMKGNIKLADIAGSMINYVDGTSASLY